MERLASVDKARRSLGNPIVLGIGEASTKCTMKGSLPLFGFHRGAICQHSAVLAGVSVSTPEKFRVHCCRRKGCMPIGVTSQINNFHLAGPSSTPAIPLAQLCSHIELIKPNCANQCRYRTTTVNGVGTTSMWVAIERRLCRRSVPEMTSVIVSALVLVTNCPSGTWRGNG